MGKKQHPENFQFCFQSLCEIQVDTKVFECLPSPKGFRSRQLDAKINKSELQ